MLIARYHSPPKKCLYHAGRNMFLTIKVTDKLEFVRGEHVKNPWEDIPLSDYESHMELKVREIIFSDIDEITELYIETYKKEPWSENWENEIAKEKIKDAIENNLSENYCIIKGNKIIGVMFGHRNYYIDRKELYIDDYFIKYNNQRNGIGKYFLEYIEKDIKRKNYSSIILITKEKFPSELFYLKNGFSVSPDMILMYKGIK